jgi:hypothetical protein
MPHQGGWCDEVILSDISLSQDKAKNQALPGGLELNHYPKQECLVRKAVETSQIFLKSGIRASRKRNASFSL